MAVELSTASTMAPDPYLLLLDLVILGVELEPKIVNTGTSLYLDPHGNSAVSHAHFSLIIHHYFENNIQIFEYEILYISQYSNLLSTTSCIVHILKRPKYCNEIAISFLFS